MKIIKPKDLTVILLTSLLISSCKESIFEPEEQFVRIYFKYGFRNELNTYENTYQKDLVWDGIVKVPFRLTAEEQNKILEKVNSVRFFSFPDKFIYAPEDSIWAAVSPDPGDQILRIKYGEQEKQSVWHYPLNEDNPQVKNLMELANLIVSVIESKAEYKKLPPARGGYD